jgi:hypothetical protein
LSIYDELTALAVARAKRLHAVQAAHEQAGARLAASLATKFGGPPERVRYAEPTDPGYGPYPTVRPGGDGFYYFELSILFTDIPPDAILPIGYESKYPLEIGIRQDGERFAVKLPSGELPTPISLNSRDDLERFCDLVVTRIRGQLSAEQTGPREFGFRFKK